MKLFACVIALVLSSAAPLGAHPLHTTLTELTEDRAHAVVRATIRVFADDFATAAKGGAAGYVSSTFVFTDPSGRALAARSCGVRRTADLMWICVEVAVSSMNGLSVRNSILCDLFPDQVNIVQVATVGRRRTLLFTRGDRAKSIS